MNVGFSGTVKGMTEAQAREFELVLAQVIAEDEDGPTVLHHGASPIKECADWEADAIARNLGLEIVEWPPDDLSSGAMLRRNQRVVDAVALLIATPRGFKVLRRSGTWSTVRRAWKAQVPVIIIWPDGRVQA